MREVHFPAARQVREDLRIEIPRRVDGRPTRSNQMPRMQHSRRKTFTPRFVQQVFLNGGFAAAIVAERPPRLLLRGWNLHAGSVDPDGAAVQKVLHLAAEPLHQLPCAVRRIANQVDHGIRAQFANPLPKRPRRLFRRAVQRDPLHLSPGPVILIRVPLAPAHVDHRVPCLHQPRREVGADVAGATDDNYPHTRLRNNRDAGDVAARQAHFMQHFALFVQLHDAVPQVIIQQNVAIRKDVEARRPDHPDIVLFARHGTHNLAGAVHFHQLSG